MFHAKTRKYIYLLFIIYLFILIKVILFKLPISVIMERLQDVQHESISSNWENSNISPLFTIKNYFHAIGKIDSSIILENILGNILLFVPLGFLIPLLFKRAQKFYYLFLLGFGISFWFELIQLLLGIGSFDVDDLLLNTIGAMFGYAVFKAIRLLYMNYPIKKNGRKG